eukprot:scaffold905_cov28-Tisochrysis_lutea.AAC.3
MRENNRRNETQADATHVVKKDNVRFRARALWVFLLKSFGENCACTETNVGSDGCNKCVPTVCAMCTIGRQCDARHDW